MRSSTVLKVFLFLTTLNATLCISQEITSNHETAAVDQIIQQASDLVASGRSSEGANLLLRAYRDATTVEDSTRLLNKTLSFYYDLGEYETVKALSETAINDITFEEEKYFQRHSQTYGFLAKYIIEIDKDEGAGLPLLYICERGRDSVIEEWCEDEIDRIKAERKERIYHDLDTRLNQNLLSYWAMLIITFASIAVFAWRLFYSKPA